MDDEVEEMKQKIADFMVGRNGADELAIFETRIVWIPLLIALFVRVPVIQQMLWFVMLAIIIHTYTRIFSRNISKRHAENQKFLQYRYQTAVKWNKKKNRLVQYKTFRFFKCPTCKQEVRVPKGHGKICITCPKCRGEFIRRS